MTTAALNSDNNYRDATEHRHNHTFEHSRSTEVDRTFQEIGGVGRFQVFAWVVICSGISSISFWIYAIGFFLQVPAY